MRKFIIREDTINEVRKALKDDKETLHDFDTGLCTLSPYMPTHLDLGNEDCCGIFMGIAEDNQVICNECGMLLNDAIEQLNKEDCSICKGKGYVTDHHDPCTECDGTGKVG